MGLGDEVYELENNPQMSTATSCGKTALGKRREEICKMECLWRKTRLPWNQGTTVESHARGEVNTVASLSQNKHWQLSNR